MANTMITCDQHDYIEIVCTFRYPLKLTLKSGVVIECVGIDTALNDQRQECIKIDAQGMKSLVVLDQLSVLEVCVNNPHFQIISFDSEE